MRWLVRGRVALAPLTVGVLLTVAAGANARPPASAARIELLVPGSRLLTPPPLVEESVTWNVSIRRTTDSISRPFAMLTRGQRPRADRRGAVTLTGNWAPPYASDDTMVIVEHGLAPVTETLAYAGAVRHYQYQGARAWGTVVQADSAPRVIDDTFPEPVFAFNEVETLVRSLPFRAGFTAIAPLFSEVDEKVEHDTMTVVESRRAMGGVRQWIIQFADPAIVTRYLVDERSRRILSSETTQRRSGAKLTYIARDTAVPRTPA